MVKAFFWAAGTPYMGQPLDGPDEEEMSRLVETALADGFDLLELSGLSWIPD